MRTLTPTLQKPKTIQCNKSKHDSLNASPFTCVLDSEEIGIISENDHRVGKCLCQFCTCGVHQCIQNKSQIKIPKSAYRTRYKTDHHRYKFETPIKRSQKLYRANKQKMELITSNMIDYQPFKLNCKQKEQRPFTPSPFKSRITQTTYKQQFPDWGPNFIQIQKEEQRPLGLDSIQFRGQSQYQEKYQNFDPQSIRIYNRSPNKSHRSSLSLGQSSLYQNTTTYTQQFNNFQMTNLNAKIRVSVPKPAQKKGAARQFITTNQSFQCKNLSSFKEPHLIRSRLLKSNVV